MLVNGGSIGHPREHAKTEIVEDFEDIRHLIVREGIRLLDIGEGSRSSRSATSGASGSAPPAAHGRVVDALHGNAWTSPPPSTRKLPRGDRLRGSNR